MEFQLQTDSEFNSRRRRGLAVSAILHLLVVVILAFNPDLLTSDPMRVIRITGEDFERDPFEVLELILPPELMAPPEQAPPTAAPPAIEPPSGVEAAPPPPAPLPPPPPEPLPPVPPAPVIGPDDVIAEGARPDAESSPSEETESGEDSPEELALVEAGESSEEGGEDLDPGEGDGEVGDGGEDEIGSEPQPEPEPVGPASDVNPPVGENTNPDGLTVPDLRGRAQSLINEVLDEERRQAGVGGRVGNADRGDQPPNLSANATEILSDTRGYDFGPYLNQVINKVRRNWYAVMPEVVRFGARGRVVLTFTIVSSGRVENLQIQARSGTVALDRAAESAIQLSNPFERIPPDFEGDHLTLQFAFLYNWDL